MGCVHAQQLHFNPQIMRLNVKITRQNSMVCVMHEARPGNLIAIKKNMTVLNKIFYFYKHVEINSPSNSLEV